MNFHLNVTKDATKNILQVACNIDIDYQCKTIYRLAFFITQIYYISRMNSAIFVCLALFCCVNLVRPALAEQQEAEPSFEERSYGRGYGGYGGYGRDEGNVFARQSF